MQGRGMKCQWGDFETIVETDRVTNLQKDNPPWWWDTSDMWCSKVARAQKAIGTAAVLVPGWHAQAGVRGHGQFGQVWGMHMIQQKIHWASKWAAVCSVWVWVLHQCVSCRQWVMRCAIGGSSTVDSCDALPSADDLMMISESMQLPAMVSGK